MLTVPVVAAPRYVRSSKLVSRELGSETLVVPVRGGVGDLNAIFSFNALGSDLWKLLETEISTESMTDWVVAHYDVTHEQAKADIQAFLSDLGSAGLIERRLTAGTD